MTAQEHWSPRSSSDVRHHWQPDAHAHTADWAYPAAGSQTHQQQPAECQVDAARPQVLLHKGGGGSQHGSQPAAQLGRQRIRVGVKQLDAQAVQPVMLQQERQGVYGGR